MLKLLQREEVMNNTNIMKNDLGYLFSQKEKASLGILSVARNFGSILANNILVKG